MACDPDSKLTITTSSQVVIDRPAAAIFRVESIKVDGVAVSYWSDATGPGGTLAYHTTNPVRFGAFVSVEHRLQYVPGYNDGSFPFSPMVTTNYEATSCPPPPPTTTTTTTVALSTAVAPTTAPGLPVLPTLPVSPTVPPITELPATGSTGTLVGVGLLLLALGAACLASVRTRTVA
jgi:hypothetical protein